MNHQDSPSQQSNTCTCGAWAKPDKPHSVDCPWIDSQSEPNNMDPPNPIRQILLEMEWCHAAKTENLDAAVAKLELLMVQERLDELKKAGDHWWNCDGDKCEFSEPGAGCGYDEHRRNQLPQLTPKEN